MPRHLSSTTCRHPLAMSSIIISWYHLPICLLDFTCSDCRGGVSAVQGKIGGADFSFMALMNCFLRNAVGEQPLVWGVWKPIPCTGDLVCPVCRGVAAKSYYGAVGISLAGLACHILCPYLQAPPLLQQGGCRLLDEALGFALQPRLVSMYRGSNPPPRRCLHFCFCLGPCRAFKGQSFQGIQQSTPKAFFPYS